MEEEEEDEEADERAGKANEKDDEDVDEEEEKEEEEEEAGWMSIEPSGRASGAVAASARCCAGVGGIPRMPYLCVCVGGQNQTIAPKKPNTRDQKNKTDQAIPKGK